MSELEINSTERFQGRTSARLDDAERRLASLNGSLEKVGEEMGNLRVAVAKITVRVSIASGAAALVGSGLVSFLVQKL